MGYGIPNNPSMPLDYWLEGLSESGKQTVSTPTMWPITDEQRGDFIPWTPIGLRKFLELDASFIGTPDYMGVAYFWHYDYRHYLRDSSPYRRRLVHKHLMAAGLDPAGNTSAHTAIVERYSRAK
jgi:hypothetical protein